MDQAIPCRSAVMESESQLVLYTMTMTLAAVFAPIGFMQGTTGKLFTEFAWTLAGAVLAWLAPVLLVSSRGGEEGGEEAAHGGAACHMDSWRIMACVLDAYGRTVILSRFIIFDSRTVAGL